MIMSRRASHARYQFMLRHITSCWVKLRHTRACHVMSVDYTSCLVMSHHAWSCHVLNCLHCICWAVAAKLHPRNQLKGGQLPTWWP